MKKIEEYRSQIDAIDDKIMTLLNDRFKYTNKIMVLKKNNNIDKFDPDREATILSHAKEHSKQTYEVYKSILKVSKDGNRSVK